MVAKISFFRVPQIAERILPFCVLVGAMSCYPRPVAAARTGGRARRRHVGLAVHRAGHVVALALGVARHHDLQSDRRGAAGAIEAAGGGDVRRQRRAACRRPRTASGCASAATTASRSSTRSQPANRACGSSGVSVFTFDQNGHFLERIEAKTRGPGTRPLAARGRARLCPAARRRDERETYLLKTNLTPAQVRESFLDAGNRAVLGASLLSSTSPSAPASPRPAIACNIRS